MKAKLLLICTLLFLWLHLSSCFLSFLKPKYHFNDHRGRYPDRGLNKDTKDYRKLAQGKEGKEAKRYRKAFNSKKKHKHHKAKKDHKEKKDKAEKKDSPALSDTTTHNTLQSAPVVPPVDTAHAIQPALAEPLSIPADQVIPADTTTAPPADKKDKKKKSKKTKK